jgi:hypothetical protein
MESGSAIINSFYINMSNINFDKGMNNDRIKNKLELRQKAVNNILFSARKLKDDSFDNKKEEQTINIKMLKEMDIPSDFQIDTFKYYENAIFL